jgi:hypothetical protein
VQVSWLSLKTKVDGFSIWAPKPAVPVSQFGPQNRLFQFDDLGLKITMTGFLVEPQNQG